MPRSVTSDSQNSPMIGVRLTKQTYEKVMQLAHEEYGSAAQVVRVAVRDFFLRRDVANSNESSVQSTQTDEVPA